MMPAMSPLSPPAASPLVTYGIGGLAVGMALAMSGLASWISRRSGIRLGIAVALVMAAQFGLAHSGVLQAWSKVPPPFMLMLVPTLVLTTRLAFSGLGTSLARRLPWAMLIGLQAFRLPLELLMHRAVREGVMPVQLSYSGWNFDILTGASALVVAFLSLKGKVGRPLVTAWNLMGSLFLATVVGIALVSMPILQAFGPDRMNTWITFPPFVWLPGILVPTALFLHLVAWRKLRIPPGGEGTAGTDRSPGHPGKGMKR